MVDDDGPAASRCFFFREFESWGRILAAYTLVLFTNFNSKDRRSGGFGVPGRSLQKRRRYLSVLWCKFSRFFALFPPGASMWPFHPRSLEVTISTIWKGHGNSPSQKGHFESPGLFFSLKTNLKWPLLQSIRHSGLHLDREGKFPWKSTNWSRGEKPRTNWSRIMFITYVPFDGHAGTKSLHVFVWAMFGPPPKRRRYIIWYVFVFLVQTWTTKLPNSSNGPPATSAPPVPPFQDVQWRYSRAPGESAGPLN